ncbi:MAG: efflux RND transporter periplasmic adaptor subunit [Planctomycetota bacterium]
MKHALLPCVVLLVAMIPLLAGCGREGVGIAPVVVKRASIVKRAVASGFVECRRETQVNTQLGGFVRKLHAKLGQRVEAGDPIAEVWPTLTERELLSAERSLQSAVEGEEAAEEFVKGEHLLATMTRFLQGERNLERMEKAAQRRRRSAEEEMRLLREGKVEIDGRVIDFVVRAPVAGHVLQLVREGDPITPASSYGAGTVIAVLGDLDHPVFRGGVDEIDVGRLREGMPAQVVLGPFPDAPLKGTVAEIGLRGRRQDGATTFDLRIELQVESAVPMRSGYSAVASIEIARADDVLAIPERVLRWADGHAFVALAHDDGSSVETEVALGLSDGMLVEVRSGLTEGQRLHERGAATR